MKTAVDLLEIEVTFSHRCQGGGGDTGAVSKMHPTLGQINTFLYTEKYTYICIFFKGSELTNLILSHAHLSQLSNTFPIQKDTEIKMLLKFFN